MRKDISFITIPDVVNGGYNTVHVGPTVHFWGKLKLRKSNPLVSVLGPAQCPCMVIAFPNGRALYNTAKVSWHVSEL